MVAIGGSIDNSIDNSDDTAAELARIAAQRAAEEAARAAQDTAQRSQSDPIQPQRNLEEVKENYKLGSFNRPGSNPQVSEAKTTEPGESKGDQKADPINIREDWKVSGAQPAQLTPEQIKAGAAVGVDLMASLRDKAGAARVSESIAANNPFEALGGFFRAAPDGGAGVSDGNKTGIGAFALTGLKESLVTDSKSPADQQKAFYNQFNELIKASGSGSNASDNEAMVKGASALLANLPYGTEEEKKTFDSTTRALLDAANQLNPATPDAKKELSPETLQTLVDGMKSLSPEGLQNVIKASAGGKFSDDQVKSVAGFTSKLMSSLPKDTETQTKVAEGVAKLVQDIKPDGSNIQEILPKVQELAQTAFGHLNSKDQKSLMEDAIKTGLTLGDANLSDAKKDALTKIITNLPDTNSAATLLKGLSEIQSNKDLDQNTKDAKTLALISDHLKQAREGEINPAIRERDRNAVADLMMASGVDAKTANIAAKVLDHIDPANKENAIKLALGLAKDKDTDPLKTLTGDAQALADKSGLTKDEAIQARKDITEAGLKLIEETAKANGMNLDRDKIIGLLSDGSQTLIGGDGTFNKRDIDERIAPKLAQNILDNPKTQEENNLRNQANWQKEAQHQAQVRQGAVNKIYQEAPNPLGLGIIRGSLLSAVPTWAPGSRDGMVHPGMTDAYYATKGQAESAMRSEVLNQTKNKLNESFTPEKMQTLNDLSKLIKASDLTAKNPIQDLRMDDLKNLENMSKATDLIANDGNPSRVTLDRTTKNENGKFELFTDKLTNQEFYKLTSPNGQERYAIKDGDEWKFLQGDNNSYNGKSYADTVNSFKESQALANQPQVLARRESDQNSDKFNYYKTQDGVIAVPKDSKYQNTVYIQEQDGDKYKYKLASPQETQAYQKAVSDWGSKPREITKPEDEKGFRVYTTNADNQVAVGVTDATRGLTFTRNGATGDWTRYQEKPTVQQAQQPVQQYPTQQPVYQQPVQPQQWQGQTQTYNQSQPVRRNNNGLERFNGNRKALGIYN